MGIGMQMTCKTPEMTVFEEAQDLMMQYDAILDVLPNDVPSAVDQLFICCFPEWKRIVVKWHDVGGKRLCDMAEMHLPYYEKIMCLAIGMAEQLRSTDNLVSLEQVMYAVEWYMIKSNE